MQSVSTLELERSSGNLPQPPCLQVADPLEAFEVRIRTEWTRDSGIAPDLFDLGVKLVSDLELDAGGEVLSTPIHDALGWDFKRFRHRPNPTQSAALLYTLNPERDWQPEVFQAKLSQPIWDPKKGKHRKYETPKGFGVRGGFPPVSDRVWKRVARRAGVVPACPIDPANSETSFKSFEFWTWVETNPAVPLTITEGYKKSQHLLSQGRACLALSGITMGVFDPDGTGKRLRPYLKRFALSDRTVFIAFDAETKPKTIRDVCRETRKLGRCFTDAGCTVRVLRIPFLPGTTKTGIDDFGVAAGPEAIARLYEEALTYAAWLWHRTYRAQRGRKPSFCLNQSELKLVPEQFPARGIVALESCKGSGKTNCIRKLVSDSDKVLLLTHRVCLGRSLAQRLEIAWKSDTDRGNGIWIANGDSPTQRIGLCVDSLLSIDPSEFRDCDLVLDEVDQVLAHLLSSSTCNKDGRRPALLARFHDLVRVARRVIVASADLTDAELEYCERLRNESDSAFLVRNAYVPDGYPVEILDAPSKSALVARLLEAIGRQQKVFVATDAKSDSKAIARLIEQIEDSAPASKTLVINSDTSGGEVEVEFIRNVNREVVDYDVVIATPSMATGVSIEVEHFDCVFGLFNGVLSDSDIAQALARVRAPVPRIVWCAKTGKNYSKASKSEYPLMVRQDLLSRWDKEICLIRSSLRPDIGAVVEEEFSFRNNPHLEHWAQIVARTNGAMWGLREGLIQRLELEGNRVDLIQVTDTETDRLKTQLKEARVQTKQVEFHQVAERGRVLSAEELTALHRKESRSPQQLIDERKTQIAKFYVLDDEQITPGWVELDDWGRFRGKVLELEALLYGREFAIARDSKTIERQAYWHQGLFLPDQHCLELRRQVRELLNLDIYIDPNREWSSQDLESLCSTARQHAPAIKSCLGFAVSEKTTNGQIFRALMAQLGLKCKTRFVGSRGEQVKLYRIDGEHWELLTEILERRERESVNSELEKQTVLTPPINSQIQDGVDTQPPEEGRWAIWSKYPDFTWLVDAIEEGICLLRGLTGEIKKKAPLDEVKLAAKVA